MHYENAGCVTMFLYCELLMGSLVAAGLVKFSQQLQTLVSKKTCESLLYERQVYHNSVSAI